MLTHPFRGLLDISHVNLQGQELNKEVTQVLRDEPFYQTVDSMVPR
jgi:hypothetical protein